MGAKYTGADSSTDQPFAVASDDSGNLYVTGYSLTTQTREWITLKYSPGGSLIWEARYGNNNPGLPLAVTLDKSKNVYVAGSAKWVGSDGDYAVIKYLPYGETLWTRFYDSGTHEYDAVYAIGVDDSGNVYVTGTSENNFTKGVCTTIKYSPNGDILWIRKIQASWYGFVTGYDLQMDGTGNIYVSGSGQGPSLVSDFFTVSYAPSGDQRWIKWYPGASFGKVRLDLDPAENVIMCGPQGYNRDFLTIKYSPCTPFSPKAGDANADDSLSLADVIATVNYYFGKAPRRYPPCDEIMYDCRVYDRICRFDWNGDGKVSLGDCIRGINYLFDKPGGPWAPVASLGCCPFPAAIK